VQRVVRQSYRGVDSLDDLLDLLSGRRHCGALGLGRCPLYAAMAFLLPLYLALRVLVTTDHKGSIRVYGFPVSQSKQVCLLYALLFVAAVAVVAAIAGQIMADETRYLHSIAYLNDSNVTIVSYASP
jgi:hypothetical protein